MSQKRILIIDDDRLVRKTLGRALSSYELVMAGNGEEALVHLDGEKPFDLILCDLMMPAFTGVELYRWLREQAPGQEEIVVFLTGGETSDEARVFLDSIPNLVIQKPFDFHSLRALVADMLGS